MAKYPAQLQSANLNEFGIVYAEEIQGHKTVATLNALYAITDPILSKSVVNTNNDAIGQEWFVTSEGCYYRLDNWANRHTASGWTKLQVIDTEFNSLSAHGADKIKNFTTSPSTVTLNYNTWRSSTVNEDGTAVINAATQSAAGVLSAADKTKLDGLNTDSINDISVKSDANKATITFVSDNGNEEDISTTIDFPISTSSAAGTMSAKDKTELDRINTANFALGAVTPAASTVGIAASKTNVTDGTTAANNITLPAATQSAAGVLSAADKTKVDRITGTNHVISQPTTTATSRVITITGINPTNNKAVSSSITLPKVSETQAGLASASDKKTLNAIKTLGNSSHLKDDGCWTRTAYDVAINFTCTDVSGNSTDTDAKSEHSVNIGAASSTLAGVMTSTDKTELDRITTANFALGAVTPAASSVAIAATKTTISTGVSAANNITLPAATASVAGVMTAADKVKLDTTLPNLINSNKTTIDNYTVNGIKISTNPVVTGANTKVTGYSKPTTTGAIAATDSINGALGKLEKKLDDEVTNRTNAVSNLTNTVNNNKTTIDNYTVGGIKISANPKVANGTNTTVSTANSTITWSLNSTISLTRVNASSGFYQTSDKRLKSDIKPLEHTLEEICSIPTDSFILGGKKDLGTIAQELEPTFPELVTDAELKQSDVPNPENFETIEKDGETYVLVKEVDYSKISILAIEGIKLLKEEIDELKKQLSSK
nr:MAG TPA: endosialidase chaperone [Ackermannviridae sp.]